MEMQDVGDIFRITLAGNLVTGKNSNDNDQHSLSACCMRGTVLSMQLLSLSSQHL